MKEETTTNTGTPQVETEQNIHKYLFFSLDNVEYGVEISMVQEIITMEAVSPIPSTLPFCKGVINIRGSVVPVLDLRIKLGKEPCEYTDIACIIVLEIKDERIGVIVEQIRDVIEISDGMLMPSPVDTNNAEQKCASSSIVEIDGNVKQILDIDRVFGFDEEETEEQ